MQDSDSDKIRKMVFEDGDFFCVFVPCGSLRVGLVKNDGKGVDTMCFCENSNGEPKKDCKYYAEIMMVYLNSLENEDGDCR